MNAHLEGMFGLRQSRIDGRREQPVCLERVRVGEEVGQLTVSRLPVRHRWRLQSTKIWLELCRLD